MLKLFSLLSYSGTFCQKEQAQRQKMKVEKSLQTSSTQTARIWLNCLKPAVCDGHKLTQIQKAENQSPLGDEAKSISKVYRNT